MQSLRQDDEQNVDMEAAPQPPQLTTSFKVQGNFGRKIGLLFGLWDVIESGYPSLIRHYFNFFFFLHRIFQYLRA